MKPEQRVVTRLPLSALFDAAGDVAARRVARVGRAGVEALLRRGPRRFVFADAGIPLRWTAAAACLETWRVEVKPHLAEPGTRSALDAVPGGYLYLGSTWALETGEEVIVLEKHH